MQPDFGQLTLRAIPHAVVVTTATGEVLDWNPAAARIFGHPFAAAHGRALSSLIVPPDLVAEEAAAYDEALMHGSCRRETLRRRLDGSLARVESVYTAVKSDQHARPLVLVTMQDVTDWRARRDADNVGASYGHLLDSTPDAIVMVNQTGHIVLANAHAHRLFGYQSGELVGQAIEVLLPGRLRNAHTGHRSAYRVQPRARAMGMGLELNGLRKDGTEFPVEISLSPLEMNDTALVMSAIRDMTERKRIQRELEQKNIELAEANRAKDMFLASMSHELRTPLHGILGFTGTLLMQLPGQLNAEQERQLRTVQVSARHLLTLINGLLDLAKIDSGRIELDFVEQDLGTIAGDVVATLRPQADARGLALELTLPVTPLVTRTDARAVKQILINLVGNAIKFTQCGKVELSASVAGPNGSQAYEICVRDTGPGIRVEDRSRVFEPFERAVDPSASPIEGTGLGLHLSRRLAEQLGGSLRIEPDTAPGSAFVLSLPVE